MTAPNFPLVITTLTRHDLSGFSGPSHIKGTKQGCVEGQSPPSHMPAPQSAGVFWSVSRKHHRLKGIRAVLNFLIIQNHSPGLKGSQQTEACQKSPWPLVWGFWRKERIPKTGMAGKGFEPGSDRWGRLRPRGQAIGHFPLVRREGQGPPPGRGGELFW